VWLTPHLRDPQPEGEREHSNTVARTEKSFDPALTEKSIVMYILC